MGELERDGVERQDVLLVGDAGDHRLPDRLAVIIPPGEPGTVDVVVRNLNGSVTVEDGFTWYEELFVDDIDPPWGLTDGDTEVRLAGIGLLADSAVTFGRGQAENVASELDRQRLRVITPPAGLPGVVDVTVRNSNGVWQGEGAFLYVRSSDGPFTVDGIAPDRVPSTGGKDVYIGGNGFDEATRVRLGDAAGEIPIACALERPQLLRCTPPVPSPCFTSSRSRVSTSIGRSRPVRFR